ncbi:MAG: hypothetical protein ACT4OG_02100 [Alphaproteobacteria bacterium]
MTTKRAASIFLAVILAAAIVAATPAQAIASLLPSPCEHTMQGDMAMADSVSDLQSASPVPCANMNGMSQACCTSMAALASEPATLGHRVTLDILLSSTSGISISTRPALPPPIPST